MEVKGRVKLDKLGAFLHELRNSRSRALTIARIRLCSAASFPALGTSCRGNHRRFMRNCIVLRQLLHHIQSRANSNLKTR